jgi:hypothetical protein
MKPITNYELRITNLDSLLLILSACLLLSGLASFNVVHAESPLSALGYGLPAASAGARSAGMGGVSLAVEDTLGLNILAPALWSGGSDARFGFNADYTANGAKDAGGSVKSDAAGINGMAVAFPLGSGRFLGAAVAPLTRMDYRWQSENSGNWTRTVTTEIGRGGMSQGLLALSLPVRSNVRLGLAGRLGFGTSTRSLAAEFPDIRSDSATTSSLDVDHRLSGFGWGVSFSWDAPEDYVTGGYLNSPIRAEVQQQRSVWAGSSNVSDATSDLAGRWELPWSAAFGVGRYWNRHLTALEFGWDGWSGVAKPVGAGEFNDAWRFAAGWEWTPEYRALDPWWRALTYRAGLSYQTLYAAAPTGHQPHKVAVSGGLSLPYFNGRSRLDLALEYGWLGDKSRDLVAENYFGISLGFHHKEPWFVSRKGAGQP